MLSAGVVSEPGLVFSCSPCRASPGVMRALQPRRGEGLLLLPGPAPAPRDPEMKPINGKGWAPAGRQLFLP